MKAKTCVLEHIMILDTLEYVIPAPLVRLCRDTVANVKKLVNEQGIGAQSSGSKSTKRASSAPSGDQSAKKTGYRRAERADALLPQEVK